ncbi:M15 family metallopeptidase [Leptolyngbya sp. FACHB-17]|uniref:M15 family metallopeptidase n=1 Tax=unclassified Leptolyngbya TaxID=2650499 RepID=UPI001681A56D|nr:M15 family metallopeptidase [Leptolyngbya sp. FACHB-17]MBD2081129.1 D-alanyl-D-alanine carboxypeptidase family protein [Leptolyngbya sp. FACHB-17]
MSNASQPGKSQQDPPSFDDIPIAERETVVELAKPKSQLLPWLWGLGGFGAIALLSGGGWFAYQAAQTRSNPTVAASPSPAASLSSQSADERLLNHFAYPEAPKSELEPISADGAMKMRSPAARAFREMVAAASAEEVILNPISAFRSISEQQQIYFEIKAERSQTLQERALVSAPPGYSEHHTGYAIDIGDGNVPATNLSPDFEKTPAFQWLSKNATRFNFELSFPKGNKQGVTYEPWHWRFVGDKASLETFYKSKEFQQQQASPFPSPSP